MNGQRRSKAIVRDVRMGSFGMAVLRVGGELAN